MIPDIRKYVRTPHVRGSRFQHGDHDMEAVPFEELQGKHLVVEEKVDGSNVGVSFASPQELLLQSRGHYLRGGPREKQFDVLKQWAAARHEELYCLLGTRYVMYAEYLYAKHTFFYDALPHYVMEFDVLDTDTGDFLSTPARDTLLRNIVDFIVPVKVLAAGTFSTLNELKTLIKRSYFISDQRLENLTQAAKAAGVDPVEAMKHTDLCPDMEGLYIKWEEDGKVLGRYKFVRDTFTSAILEQETHWVNRPIIQNQLLSGAFERMFQ